MHITGTIYGVVYLSQLRRRRFEAGLTQDELAARVGVSRYAISQIEQKHVQPRVTTIRRLAEVLKCAPSDLMEPEG